MPTSVSWYCQYHLHDWTIWITYPPDLLPNFRFHLPFQMLCGGIPTINTPLQMVCTFIDTICKYTTCIMWSLRRSFWCYWSAVDCGGRATCSWRRLMALLLGRLLGVLHFTGARSMGCAVQLSPMKPESWSGWFPLKSSPTCSCRWLHCDLQNVPREQAKCSAGNVRANRSEASCWLRSLVNLQPTVCRPVCLGVGLLSGTHDQIFLFCLTIVGFLM
jgi:hypothetical protein